MLRITQYTRASEHTKEIRTLDNGDKQNFCLSLSHYQGCYFATWKRETTETHNGYNTTTYLPFADDSGRARIKDGRFSRAFLEKCDKVLADNLQKYFDIWQQGDYQRLATEIYNDIIAMK